MIKKYYWGSFFPSLNFFFNLSGSVLHLRSSSSDAGQSDSAKRSTVFVIYKPGEMQHKRTVPGSLWVISNRDEQGSIFFAKSALTHWSRLLSGWWRWKTILEQCFNLFRSSGHIWGEREEAWAIWQNRTSHFL